MASSSDYKLALCLAMLLANSLAGCSAFRPVSGVPAELLSDTYRLPTRSGQVTIDLSLLGQVTPAEYRLDRGDVLGVYIDGELGADIEVPPIAGPNATDIRPSLGYPVEVEADGSIALPTAGRVKVSGLTLNQSRDLLRRLFVEQLGNLPQSRIFVTLQKQRSARVLVIRQENSRDTGIDRVLRDGGADVLRRGLGQIVDLPAYQNDVLHALTATGGLPGFDAENAVYIIRQQGMRPACPMPVASDGGHTPPDVQFLQTLDPGNSPHTLRIPLKVHPGEPLPFGPADVILQSGDVVYIESRTHDFFYTSGLLGGGQYQLPRDYDLDALAALAIVQRNLEVNQNTKAIGGRSALNKDVTVGASKLLILRPQPDGNQTPIEVDLYEAVHNPRERIIIRPGDTLMLQYTRSEACAAFIERHLFEGLILGASSTLFLRN